MTISLQNYLSRQASASLTLFNNQRSERLRANDDDHPYLVANPRLPFTPRGAALALLECDNIEVVIDGPAGTGKTRAALEKVHQTLMDFPGARALVVRQTRASLSETALVTYEDEVLGANHPILQSGAGREHRMSYKYPNGSRLVVGGMDKPSRIMSSQYDIIFVPEATEIALDAWEYMLTRLRNGVVSIIGQIIGDCNPGVPSHWILKRALTDLTFLKSKHQDNPVLHDGNDWTARGVAYVQETLGRLTGTRRERLLEGRWVQAAGAIYPNFDIVENIDPRLAYDPLQGYVLWGVDDGFRNERTVLICQQTNLGGLNVLWEYAKSLVPDSDSTVNDCLVFGDDLGVPGRAQTPESKQDAFIAAIVAIRGNIPVSLSDIGGAPDLCLVDASAARLMAGLHARGLSTARGNNATDWNVENGISHVRSLICDSNGARMIKIHPRCTRLIESLQAYHYDTNGKPVKVDDHLPDALRYACRNV